jgi:hypothetical protein
VSGLRVVFGEEDELEPEYDIRHPIEWCHPGRAVSTAGELRHV